VAAADEGEREEDEEEDEQGEDPDDDDDDDDDDDETSMAIAVLLPLLAPMLAPLLAPPRRRRPLLSSWTICSAISRRSRGTRQTLQHAWRTRKMHSSTPASGDWESAHTRTDGRGSS